MKVVRNEQGLGRDVVTVPRFRDVWLDDDVLFSVTFEQGYPS